MLKRSCSTCLLLMSGLCYSTFGLLGASDVRASGCNIPRNAHLLVSGEQSFGGKSSEPVKLDIVLGRNVEVHSFDRLGRLDATLTYRGILPAAGLNGLKAARLHYDYSPIAGDPDALHESARSTYRRVFTFNDVVGADDTISSHVEGRKSFRINGCVYRTVKIATHLRSNISDDSEDSVRWYSKAVGYDLANNKKRCAADGCNSEWFRVVNVTVLSGPQHLRRRVGR